MGVGVIHQCVENTPICITHAKNNRHTIEKAVFEMLYKEILGDKRESSLSNPNGLREIHKARRCVCVSSLQFTQTLFYINAHKQTTKEMANVRQFKRLHLISVFRGLSPNTVEEGGPVHLKYLKILRYCLEDPDLLVFSQKAQKYKRALPPQKIKS